MNYLLVFFYVKFGRLRNVKVKRLTYDIYIVNVHALAKNSVYTQIAAMIYVYMHNVRQVVCIGETTDENTS